MSGSFGYGFQDPNVSDDEFSVICFIVRQMMNQMSTMKLVQVKAVTSNGAVAAAGTVDVLPLVSQIDGQNNITPHGTVYGLPWWRLQGGANAVICDPQVDDIGYVVVSDRDMSAALSSKAQSPPGSRRSFDLADGIYVGGIANAVPTQYLAFTDDGVKIVDKNGNIFEMKSGSVSITATTLAVTGNITATGSITAGQGGGDQVGLQTHRHTQGNDSAGNIEQATAAPTAGT